MIEGVETCDDGNVIDLDGCNANCHITGSIVWEVTYDSGPGQCDYYYDVNVGPGGRIAAVGSVGKTGNKNDDCEMLINVYEADGTLAWSEIPNVSPRCDELWGVDWDAQGNLWVGGTYTEAPPQEREQWVALYDGNGNQQWSAVWGLTADDYGYGISVDGNGRGILVGANAGLNQLGTVRVINPDGSSGWDRTISMGFYAYALDVAIRGDRIYVTGFGEIPLDGEDGFIHAYDLQGNLQWWKIFNGVNNLAGHDRFGGIAVADDGTLAVAGFKWVNPNQDIWTLKLDELGNTLWSQDFNNPQLLWADRGQDVAVDSQGNIITVGATWDPGDQFNNFDTFLRRYDPNGNVLFSEIDNGGVDGGDGWFGVDIAAADEYVVAGGMTFDPANCSDAVLRLYAP